MAALASRVCFASALVAVFFAACQGTRCPVLTPESEAGPVFKWGAPIKPGIVCDPPVNPAARDGNGTVYEADPQFCWGPVCLHRKAHRQAPRLHIEGAVVDTKTCKPVRDAIVEVWQTDRHGHYGSLQPDVEDGHCRARILPDEKTGHFSFETDVPGMYGLANGQLPLGIDLPPFSPQHIHVLVEAPGYEVFSTQLFLHGDVAGEHDWRAALFSDDLGFSDPRTHLNVTTTGAACKKMVRSGSAPLWPLSSNGERIMCASFAVGLTPEASAKAHHMQAFSEAARRAHVAEKVCHYGHTSPLPVCHPWLLRFLRTEFLLPIGIVLALTALMLVSRAWRLLGHGLKLLMGSRASQWRQAHLHTA